MYVSMPPPPRTPAGTTADDLLALFDRCGEVLDIRIPRDRR
jgi:RNA recognition motif-containing protein